MTLIIRFLDTFLSTSQRSNPSDIMRGYTLVGMIFVNILLSLLALAGMVFFFDLGENALIAITLDVFCIVGYVTTLILFKNTKNHVLCSNFMITILAGVIFFGVQITGGYFDSPVLQFALQLPITAFLLLGLRLGIAWLLITLLLSIGCYFSALYDFAHLQLAQEQGIIDTMYFALQLILLLIAGGALIIYEMINKLLNQKLHEERNKFEHKASHDDLTGIANRFEFFRRLKTEIGEANEREHKVGVVYIDLDGFKPVNDIYGHHMGDEALKVIAIRLRQVLRLSDTTARLGGDEFALILPGIHVPNDIEVIMPKVLAAIKEPIYIDDVQVVVFGSCGVSIYPDHSTDYDVLCRYADVAMYQAKEKQDAYQVFSKEMMV